MSFFSNTKLVLRFIAEYKLQKSKTKSIFCNGLEASLTVAAPHLCFRRFATGAKESFKEHVRLSKRISELDLCSRREADRLISIQQHTATTDTAKRYPIILLRGKPILPILGQKVSADETDIVIVHPHENTSNNIPSNNREQHQHQLLWDRIKYDTVVLNKPLGYVSGQPEAGTGYKPAVQLLAPNKYDYLSIKNNNIDIRRDVFPYLKFSRRKTQHQQHHQTTTTTLQGYVPAGRLDMNSTGLLIFTKNGVIAKKLVSSQSELEKEYIVRVTRKGKQQEQQRQQNNYKHINIWPDLTPLLRGGYILDTDTKPLFPLKHAEWIYTDENNNDNDGISSSTATLKLVLKEGRKRQIRRMCEEMLGLQVISLERVRIGPKLHLGDLPLGKWRLLDKTEVMDILVSSISSS